MNARAPLVVSVLLLVLPIVYVGSYIALVRPEGIRDEVLMDGSYWTDFSTTRYYLIIGDSGHQVYWPLEQIDRKVRPKAWI